MDITAIFQLPLLSHFSDLLTKYFALTILLLNFSIEILFAKDFDKVQAPNFKFYLILDFIAERMNVIVYF